MKFTQLLLASQLSTQPELLAGLKVPFKRMKTQNHISKFQNSHPQPAIQAAVLARAQGYKTYIQNVNRNASHRGEWVLSLYTLIETKCNHQTIPCNRCNRKAIIEKLGGHCCQVHTGLALLDPYHQQEMTHFVTTRAWIRPYEQQEIETGESNVETEEIENIPPPLNLDMVLSVSGCPANILGMPLCSIANMLEVWGLSVDLNIHSLCRRQLGIDCRNYMLRSQSLI
ncbi:MAG: Maf family protein [Anaerolineae bacterium]|nr:Maf family protein [Anaerolineae bacterium]